MLKELNEILEAFKWTWENMGSPHTSDHFNIPANGITILEDLIKKNSKENLIEKFSDLNLNKVHFIPLIENWLSYKAQKRQTYKPIGLKTLIKKFNQFEGAYSELESLIENSIINNYSGIIWSKNATTNGTKQTRIENFEQGFREQFAGKDLSANDGF